VLLHYQAEYERDDVAKRNEQTLEARMDMYLKISCTMWRALLAGDKKNSVATTPQ
jgi:hypothetical protein